MAPPDPEPGEPVGADAPYLVTILYDHAAVLDGPALHAAVRARCGADATVMGELTSELASFAFPAHQIEYADRTMPAMAIVSPIDGLPDAAVLESSLQQTWDWDDARAAVAGTTHGVVVSDFCAQGLAPAARLALFHGLVAAVLETTPGARAILWSPARRVVEPQAFLAALTAAPPDPLWAALNVRYFQVGNGRPDEAVMDTAGLTALGLPDVQCHFAGLDPGRVAGFLGGIARYLFVRGPVIKPGHTVPGPAGEGWKVRHEQAIVEPARLVLDVEPHAPHSTRTSP